MEKDHSNKSSFLHLSNEILHLICGYLSLSDILLAFDISQIDLQLLINGLYSKMKLNSMRFNEFKSILKVFSHSKCSLRPSSFTLNNEQISSLMNTFFRQINSNTLKSLFNQLKHLMFISCHLRDLRLLELHYTDLIQLESLSIIDRQLDEKQGMFIFPRDCSFSNQSI